MTPTATELLRARREHAKSEAVRVRLDPGQAQRLKVLVDYAQEHGIEGVTQSELIRAALESFMDAMYAELKIEEPAGGSP